MTYAMRKNDYNSATQLNLSNYENLYPLIFFDLSFQTEKVTRDPKQIVVCQPTQIKISVFMLLFCMKKALLLIKLETNLS